MRQSFLVKCALFSQLGTPFYTSSHNGAPLGHYLYKKLYVIVSIYVSKIMNFLSKDDKML